METPADLWQDMATLNALYEELCWDPEVVLEFIPDYENDCIIIRKQNAWIEGLVEVNQRNQD